MEVALRHALSYSTKGDVPVAIVAKNLLANERLVQESLRVLGDCIDGLEIQKVTVKVAYVSNESPLKEIFAIGLFLAFQKDLEQEVPDIIQRLTGHTVPDSADTLVTVLVLIAAIYVIDATIKRVFPGKEAKLLKKAYKDKIAELSTMTGIDQDTIERQLEKRLSEGKQKSLFKRAHDFFLPAKIEPNVNILIENNVVINQSVIAEIPSDIDFAQVDKTNSYDLSGVRIEIHRADKDYSQSGWVAVIEEVSDKRRKMVLPPDISPSDLFGRDSLTGDISVVEQMQDDGEYVTKEYHLLRLSK